MEELLFYPANDNQDPEILRIVLRKDGESDLLLHYAGTTQDDANLMFKLLARALTRVKELENFIQGKA